MIRSGFLIGVFAFGIGSAAAQQQADSLDALNKAPVHVAPEGDARTGPEPQDPLSVDLASPVPSDSVNAGISLGAGETGDWIHVRVATNARNALLFADSTYIGRVTKGFVGVPSHTQQLRLTLEDASAWSVPPVEMQLQAEPGDSVEVELPFPYRYRIESVPFGAEVHLDRGSEWILLGSTPLLHTSTTPLEYPLVVERSGFAVERLSPGSEVWNRHLIMLEPSADEDPSAAQVDWRPPRPRRAWIDYAALGTALVAGVVAVHYKFKADDLYATYQETADPALRDDIHAHDVRSGVAFGVMQGGLGLFAIRLILR